MARPIPISNKKAEQWNKFLVYFNDRAVSELPKDDKGASKWELLDKNDSFGNYSSGQDFYKKKFAEFVASENLTASDDLTEADFPVIQTLYQDIYTAGQAEPEYKKHLDFMVSSQGNDPKTWNPVKTATDKSNNEGWVGTVSRNMYLPMETGPLSKSTNKVLQVPKSFNQGESFYTDARRFGAYYMEDGGAIDKVGDEVVEIKGDTHEKGGEDIVANGKKLEAEKGEIVDMTNKEGRVYSDNEDNEAIKIPATKDFPADMHGMVPAKAYKLVQAKIDKFKGDNRPHVKNIIAHNEALKDKIFDHQQNNNGQANNLVAQDGTVIPEGEATPPTTEPWRFFMVGDKKVRYASDDIAKIKVFQSKNPDAKEFVRKGQEFVELETPLGQVGQKKNKPASTGSTGETTPDPDVSTSTIKSDWNLGKGGLPELDVDFSQTKILTDPDIGNLYMDEHKKIVKDAVTITKSDYNDLIEPRLEYDRKEGSDPTGMLFGDTFLGDLHDKNKAPIEYNDKFKELIAQNGPEYEKVLLAGARISRDEVNSFLGNKLLGELYKTQDAILSVAEQDFQEGKQDQRTVTKWNIQDSPGFDITVEDYITQNQNKSFTMEDGTVVNTKDITP